MTFTQSGFDIRCEWGEQGVAQLAPTSDVVIIVDVMSFSTCVEIAVGRGAIVYPYRWKDMSSREFADSIGAELAGARGKSRYSLSPASLLGIPEGTRLVLPSPNGAELTLAAGSAVTFAGCLRNCRAVAEAAMRQGRQIAIIPAGERWKDDETLRPAFEDWVGAGAIIHHLDGSLSPESRAALAAYRDALPDLPGLLRQSCSGKELIDRGFAGDLGLIAETDVSGTVPIFRDRAYGIVQG
jgi:2-phosphosulfolactate phosphatase